MHTTSRTAARRVRVPKRWTDRAQWRPSSPVWAWHTVPVRVATCGHGKRSVIHRTDFQDRAVPILCRSLECYGVGTGCATDKFAEIVKRLELWTAHRRYLWVGVMPVTRGARQRVRQRAKRANAKGYVVLLVWTHPLRKKHNVVVSPVDLPGRDAPTMRRIERHRALDLIRKRLRPPRILKASFAREWPAKERERTPWRHLGFGEEGKERADRLHEAAEEAFGVRWPRGAPVGDGIIGPDPG